MFGNIKQAVGGFFSNLFGGNRDDDKARREREAAERRRQQAVANARSVEDAQRSFQAPSRNGFNPMSQGQLPPQMKQQQAVYDQMRNPGKLQESMQDQRKPQMTEAQKKALEATEKAAEQLKQIQRSNVRDVNNYRKSDADKLKQEISKGENADLRRIEGLLRSVKNRQDELQRYKQNTPSFSKAIKENVDNRTVQKIGDTIGFHGFLKEEKKDREEARKAQVRQGLNVIDEQTGGTITDLRRKYNDANAFEQSKIRKELEKRASMNLTYGNKNIEKERDEARLALLALDVYGKEKFEPVSKTVDFVGGMLGGMKDFGANILDSTSALVNKGDTFSDAVTGIMKNTGMIDDEEVIRRVNAAQNRLGRFTGGKDDRGLADRVIRSAAAGAEAGSYFIPGAAAAKGFKQAGGQTLKQALTRDALMDVMRRTAPYIPANAGAAGAAAFREGTDTKVEDVLTEAALGGLFAAAAPSAGSITRGGINSTKNSLEGALGIKRLDPAVEAKIKKEAQEKFERDQEIVRQKEKQAQVDSEMPTFDEMIRLARERDAQASQGNLAPLEPSKPVIPPIEEKSPPSRPSSQADEAMRKIEAENEADLKLDSNLTQMEDGSIVDINTGEIVRESPAVRLKEAVESQKAEASENIQKLDEIETRQASPEAGATPSEVPESDINNAYSTKSTPTGNAIPDNYLAELERRRANFAADEDRALLEATSGQRLREEGYDPIAPINREDLASRLTKLGVDPTSFEGVSVSRLSQIIDNAEKANNPGGYIRTALERMNSQQKYNPTMAAINPLPSRKPVLNERGEVVVGADGKIQYEDTPKAEAPGAEAPAPEPRPLPETNTSSSDDIKPAGDPPAGSPPADSSLPARGQDGTYTTPFLESLDPDMLPEQRIGRVKELSDTIVGSLEERLQQAGSSADNFFRKLEQARNGNNTLTPDELNINQWYQAELENIARYAEQVHKVNIGRRGDGYYSPEYIDGRSSTSASQLTNMFEGGEMAGSTYKNEGKAREVGLDYSSAPTERYIQEMLLYGGGQSKAGQVNKLVDSLTEEAAKEGRRVDASSANKAASKMLELMDKMSYAAAAGRGQKAKATVEHLGNQPLEKKLEKVPVVQTMNEIGKLLNKATVPVEQLGNAAENFTLRGKVNNMQIGDSTLGAQGVNVFYEARGYAERVSREAFEAMDTVSSHLEVVMDKLKYLSDQDRGRLLQDLSNKALEIEEQVSKLPSDKQADAYVALNANAATSTLRKAARMNIVELAQRVDIQNPHDLKTFQNATNRIIVNERIQQGYVDQIVDGVSQWINAGLRGYNPKSAATELGDLGEIAAVVGRDFLHESLRSWNPKQAMDTMSRWGRMGSLDPRGDFMQKNADLLGRIHQVASSDNKLSATKNLFKAGIDPMLLIKGVTLYKESLALNALENYWTRQGLSGAKLVDRVYRDYYETVLPSSPLNKSVLSDSSISRLLFQYQNWQAMNALRTYNFMTGKSDAGRLSEMGRAKRAGTFAGTAGATKLGLWAVQNTLFGSSLAMSFGLFDPLGITQGDFTGVDNEDKNFIDRLAAVTSFSPFLSLGTSAYFAHRKEEERANKRERGEYAAGDQSPEYNIGNTVSNLFERTKNMMLPGANQFFRSDSFVSPANEGYSVNQDGRVQYQTPEAGSLDWFRGLFGGKNATAPAREYGDSSDILRDPLGAIKKDATVDNLMQLFRGEGTRDYNRPLATSTYDKGYNEQALEATKAAEDKYGKNSPEARQVMRDWIENGKKYNKTLDEFKKNNPDMHKRWLETMDDDVISPEKWQIYRGNPDIFKFMQERKKLEARDLGRAIDPIYTFPPEQAALILQERSAHTGDDMHLRTIMYRQPWYKDFKNAEAAYYDSMAGAAERDGGSERAKQWYQLSNQLGSPEGVKSKYPLVQEQSMVTEQYGFGSPESKAWFSANADAYLAEKAMYDEERFGIVNQMRALEGVDPMSWEQFKAKIQFPEEKTSGGGSGKSYGKSVGRRGGRGGSRSQTPSEAYDRNTIAYVDTRMGGTEAPRAKRLDMPEKLKFDTSPGGRLSGKKKVRLGGASKGGGKSTV